MSFTFTSQKIVALSRAIDAAMDRGDVDEAIRLSSMQWEQVRRWLEEDGFPAAGHDDGDGE
jgi:hypothetical protein